MDLYPNLWRIHCRQAPERIQQKHHQRHDQVSHHSRTNEFHFYYNRSNHRNEVLDQLLLDHPGHYHHLHIPLRFGQQPHAQELLAN